MNSRPMNETAVNFDYMMMTSAQMKQLTMAGVCTPVDDGFVHIHFARTTFNIRAPRKVKEQKPKIKKRIVLKRQKLIEPSDTFDWDLDFLIDLNDHELQETVKVIHPFSRGKRHVFTRSLASQVTPIEPQRLTHVLNLIFLLDKESENSYRAVLQASNNSRQHSLNGNICDMCLNVREDFVEHSQNCDRTLFGWNNDVHSYVMIDDGPFYEFSQTRFYACPQCAEVYVVFKVCVPRDLDDREHFIQLMALGLSGSDYLWYLTFLRKRFFPSLHSENFVKEDTKRNSKTVRSTQNNRDQRLVSQENKHAIDRMHKNQKITKSKRQEAAHRATMAQLHGFFDINVNLSIFDKMEEIFNGLPPEYKKTLDIAEVLASLKILWDSTDIAAIYLALRSLYKQFKMQGMTLTLFTALALRVLSVIKNNFPKLESKYEAELHGAKGQLLNNDPITVLVTLLLSVFFGGMPGKGRVATCLNVLPSLRGRVDGVNTIVEALQGVVKYVRGVSDPALNLDEEIDKIEARVKHYLSPQGDHEINFEAKAFNELAELQSKCMEMTKFLSYHSPERIRLSPIAFNCNMLYRRALMTPSAGHGYRKRPVVVHLWGSPGIGKTHLINILVAEVIGHILRLDGFDDERIKQEVLNFEKYIFYSPQGMKYETGFNTQYSKVYVCDDANQVNPSFVGDGAPFPVKLIPMNNSHDLTLNVAEVENKANAKFNSSLIIATDNSALPDTSYLASTEAYIRRLDFRFQLVLKDEFSKPSLVGTTMLKVIDTSKIDVNQINTHIYNFVCENTQKVYTYEQAVGLIIEELYKVDASHKGHIKSFGSFALSKVNAMLQGSQASGSSTTVVDPPAGPSGLSSSKVEDTQTTTENASAPSDTPAILPLVDVPLDAEKTATTTPIQVPVKHSRNILLELEGESRSVQCENHSWWDKFLYFLVWAQVRSGIYSIRRKFGRRVALPSRTFLLASAVGIIVSGYGIYKLYDTLTTKKKRPSYHTGYNNGDASDKKQKPKGPQKDKPIASKPLFPRQQADEKIRYEAQVLANTPLKELDSGRAFAILKLLCSNAFLIQYEFRKDGETRIAMLRGFFIRSGLFMVNRHLLEGVSSYDEYARGQFHLYNVFETKLSISAKKVEVTTFVHEGEKDQHYDVICLDFGTNVSGCVDLTKYGQNLSNFLSQSEMSAIEGEKIMVVTCEYNGQFVENERLQYTGKAAWYMEVQHTKVIRVMDDPLVTYNEDGELDAHYNTIEYPMCSVPGYCGSVVICNTPSNGGRILGIHMAGYPCNDRSYAQLITSEIIASLDVKRHAYFAPSALMYQKPFHTYLDTSFRRVDVVESSIYTNSRTRIGPSILHNEVMITTKKPARLGILESGEHVVNKAMKKYTTPSIGLTDWQSQLTSLYMHEVFRPTRRVQFLSHEVAIRGIEGHPYIRAINRSSSAGYPFVLHTKKKGKRDFLGNGDDFIYDHPLLLELLDQYKQLAKENIRPPCFYISNAKDELRVIEKVDAGKTRSFAAAPLHYVILFRQCYLDLFANIMENRITNTSLVGVNPYSSEWDYLVSQFAGVAHPGTKSFIAGDYSNFDGTLSTDILWAIHSFIESQYQRTPEQSQLSSIVWRDIVSSFQLFGNTVVNIVRGQPSGNPGTALINTMFNSSVVFLALYEIMEDIGTIESYTIQEDLLQYYYGIYYGDDNIIGFHDRLKKIFHPTMLQHKLATYGLVYTTDLKDDTEFEYRTLYEVSILKRRFIADRENNNWLAPLEIPSIIEPLNWEKCDHRDYDARVFQMQMNARLAIRELSLHNEDVFNEYRTRILKACAKHKIQLDMECSFPQRRLREILRRGEYAWAFSVNDNIDVKISQGLELPTTVFLASDEDQAYPWTPFVAKGELGTIPTKRKRIHVGRRAHGSPMEVLQPQTVSQYYPTRHGKIRVAQTTKIDNVISAHDQESESVGQIPFRDETEDSTTGQQIVSFSTVEAPIVSTVAKEKELDNKFIANILENRTHTIDDVVSREYVFDQFVIPIGGASGDILKRWKILDVLISQPNVYKKLSGFAFMRTELFIRLEFAVQPYTSGGVMLSLFPDLETEAINNRLTLMQLSQVPNLQSSLPTCKSLQIRVPFVSPFLGRDLTSGIGDIGEIVLSRLTPSAIGAVSVTAYVSGDKDTLHVQYPTLLSPMIDLAAREHIRADLERDLKALEGLPQRHGKSEAQSMQKKGVISGILETGSKIATLASGIPVVGTYAAAAAPILNIGGKIAGAFGLSKPPSDKPVVAMKWKPGDGQLTGQGVLSSHLYTLDYGTEAEVVDGEFGSSIDEMTTETVMRVPNIIETFPWSSSDSVGKVLWKAPCTIAQFKEQSNSALLMTHQMWMAAMCQNWLADLIFDFDFYNTHYHRGKLRFSYVPMDYGTYKVGDIFTADSRNLVTSHIVEFNGNSVNHSQRIQPAQNLSMMYMPNPYGTDSGAGMAKLRETQYTRGYSYGTLYVSVEVKLEVTAAVAPTIFTVVSFSADKVALSNPTPALPYLPMRHTQTSTLGTDFNKYSRAERIAMKPDMVHGNSIAYMEKDNLKITMGDEVLSWKNLLNAYTVFSEDMSVSTGSILKVKPYMFRALSDNNVTANTIDLVDYVAVGYAFYKGGMNLRMVAKEGSLDGESYILCPFQHMESGGVPPPGVITYGGNWKMPRSGTRVVPVAGTEWSPDFSIPYYQGFHIARVLPGQSSAFEYNKGTSPTEWQYRPFKPTVVRLYRAVADGFKFGYLISLPLFRLGPDDITASATPIDLVENIAPPSLETITESSQSVGYHK